MVSSSRRRRLQQWFVCTLLAVGCSAPTGAPERASAAEPAPGEREPLEIALWRAGRGIPPGLSAARRGELEAARARAVQRLDERWRPAMDVRLVDLLQDSETSDELWCAGASAVAWLERYRLSRALGAALTPSAPARKNVSARAALHQLYGRWFRNAAELEPYLESVRGGAGTRMLLESLREEERRSRERLMAQLVHEPGAASAWLSDPDPEIRSGAARILARVFRGKDEGADAVLDVLVTHLESESEPHAFHEVMQACLVRLERSSPDDPAGTRLRALMVEIARSPGDPRTLTVAQALARVSWRMDGPRDLGHLLSGVDFLGSMLRGLAAVERERGANDPDPLIAVLVAMRQLCDDGGRAGLTRELRASAARDNLFEVLGDALQDEAVRAAAAAALGPLTRASDGPRLAQVLADPEVGAPVKHALLGSLAAILAAQEAGAQGVDELLNAVATLTGVQDSDLRRRALALFADPELERLVRGLDPTFLVQRLGSEDGREATLEILGLLQRFGHEDMLAPLLALARFDQLCDEAVTLEALVTVLERLKGSSAGAAMASASRIAAARSEDTSLARLRHALALVASLEIPAALELAPEEHSAIIAWVGRVVAAGVLPRDLVPGALAFEERLLEVHMPRAQKGAPGAPAFEHAHLVALLRADLFLGGAASTARTTKAQVEAAFETAQALAPLPGARLLVLRDRARFRAAASEGVKALSDYRRLFEAGAEAEALLGIPDLRTGVELLGRLDEVGGPGRSATAGEAAELIERLIARNGWRAEPASVRMQDLRDWVAAALEARGVERLRRMERTLADLPLTQVEAQGEVEPVPVWSGLTREGDWFQELLDLRARVRIGLRDLEAQG